MATVNYNTQGFSSKAFSNNAGSGSAPTYTGAHLLNKDPNHWTKYIKARRSGLFAEDNKQESDNSYTNKLLRQTEELQEKEKSATEKRAQEDVLQRIKNPIERAKIKEMMDQSKVAEIEFVDGLKNKVEVLKIAKVEQENWVQFTKNQGRLKERSRTPSAA